MEAAALFYLAARARAAGKDVSAACILTVSDTLGETEAGAVETTEETYMALEDLEAATRRMIEIALEAGTAAHR
jgi:purine-nucleoside phosphorylase